MPQHLDNTFSGICILIVLYTWVCEFRVKWFDFARTIYIIQVIACRKVKGIAISQTDKCVIIRPVSYFLLSLNLPSSPRSS